MNPKVILPIALAIILVAGGVWAWFDHRNADHNQLTLYGNVDIRQVSLAFNATERIAELRANEGDRVHAGDVLGVLDVRTVQVRIAQTEALIGAQEQALLRLKTGSRPEEIAEARANSAAAQAEAELATQQVNRLQAVKAASGGRAVAQQDLDNALSHQKIAIAQSRSADNAAQLVILGARKEVIGEAQSQLASARAERALVQRQLDESELRAPIDAIVRARLLEPGDMASPQRPVFTLAIMQPKWVRAYVPETRLSQLQAGMGASVSTDSDPDHSLPARLGYISSVAEFTPKTVQTEEQRTSLVYEVRFMVDDPRDVLRLGMPATVHLRLSTPSIGRPPRS